MLRWAAVCRDLLDRSLLWTLGDNGYPLISMVSTLGFPVQWRYLIVLFLKLPLLEGKLLFLPGKGVYMKIFAPDLTNGSGWI